MKAMAPELDFTAPTTMRRALDKAYVEAATRARVLRYRNPTPTESCKWRCAGAGRHRDHRRPECPAATGERRHSRVGSNPASHCDKPSMASWPSLLTGSSWRCPAARAAAAVASDPTLRSLWDSFAVYDEAMLPLRDLLPGENDDIEVLRVSPRDTWRLVDDSKQGPKLAGSQIHHFGGFFSAEWRRNDILWGRLDAAERLISALWPASGDGDGTDEDKARRRQRERRSTRRPDRRGPRRHHRRRPARQGLPRAARSSRDGGLPPAGTSVADPGGRGRRSSSPPSARTTGRHRRRPRRPTSSWRREAARVADEVGQGTADGTRAAAPGSGVGRTRRAGRRRPGGAGAGQPDPLDRRSPPARRRHRSPPS